jgi:uncharacterized protein YggU (UPF0235/DUF167 family)
LSSATADNPAGRKPWRHGDACVIAHFRLTPKSSKDAVEGITDTGDGPAFQARVRAVPENGAANAALEDVVARWLGLPKRSVSLVSGGKSRLKSLRIAGDAVLLDQILQVKVDEFQR